MTSQKTTINQGKPLLLLHICCGPCATHVLDIIKDTYHLTGFFYNPNLYPKKEFDKRLNAAIELSKIHGIGLYVPVYQPGPWLQAVQGRDKDPEGGMRCKICIHHRLETAARIAKNCEISAFGTTLTISPHKDSNKINEIGNNISKELYINYLDADFKKNNGFAKSIKISKSLNLYRQNYCGCYYSMR